MFIDGSVYSPEMILLAKLISKLHSFYAYMLIRLKNLCLLGIFNMFDHFNL